ncbi:MAG TPA: DNA/RNA nuclease SfsA [Rhodospirillales bacterium]|jgi:sugar fermentation stimulation protein A|nr:DNA/RNA nuclease SfsA [Rhodospirillales bacterium]
MRFAAPLIPGTLLRRYKRFLADVALPDGTVVTAHCPNSGSMLSVDVSGAEVWLSPAPGRGRKLAYTWELIRLGGCLVGINTARPNALAAEAIAAGAIAELAGYETVRREIRCGPSSRIDLLLEAADRPKCFVEVKNVTLQRPNRPGLVEFPDCVTARGVKHLVDLATAVADGHRAAMLFLAQREDGDVFAIADDLDPAYAAALVTAMAAGVEVLCYRCALSLDEIRVADRLAFAGAACDLKPARASAGRIR